MDHRQPERGDGELVPHAALPHELVQLGRRHVDEVVDHLRYAATWRDQTPTQRVEDMRRAITHLCVFELSAFGERRDPNGSKVGNLRHIQKGEEGAAPVTTRCSREQQQQQPLS